MIIKERAPSVLLLLLPLSATAIFLLDIFSPFSPYTSGLFVPLVLLSLAIFSTSGVAYTGLVCVVMTFIGYILSHNDGFDLTSVSSLGIILAGIVVTTAIAMGVSRRLQ